MSNPISPAREWLYAKLASSTVLVTTYAFTVYPEWPQEGTVYPMCFLQETSGNLITPIGSDRIDAQPTIDIHLVFKPRTLLSVRDAVVDEVMKAGFIHRSRGGNSKGLVSACSIESKRDIPYRVLDDYYARTIIGCKFFSNGN